MNNREIKFRAWHKRTKVMIDWRMLSLLLNGTPIAVTEGLTEMLSRTAGFADKTVLSESYHSCNIFELKGIELMQYTGLKDKNGKEIWEGDIVKWIEGDDEISTVIFEAGGFWLDNHDNEYGWPPAEDLEVIGNIYENPELLNK